MKRLARITSLIILSIALLLWGLREDFQRSHLIAGVLWREHTALARTFFARSAAHDSVGLVALSDGPQPVAWGLTFGRVGNVAAAAAASGAKVTSSWRVGDSSVVVEYDVPARWCPNADEPHRLQLKFVLHGTEWRVAFAGAMAC
jgi:hypothetical protein